MKYTAQQSSRYQLYGVISHNGPSTHTGHCKSKIMVTVVHTILQSDIAHVQCDNNEWYCCDDHSVLKTTEDEVKV